MKAAYICEPQVGGTFVFFSQIRPELARHGIDFRCIPPFDCSAYRNTRYWEMEGLDFLSLPEDPREALGAVLRHLAEQDFQAVLVLPGCSLLGTVLPAHLPVQIGCAAKIPHNGRGTYRPAREMEPYLDALAPVNYLLAEDLSRRYGVPERKIRVIHIGIDPNHFAYRERGRKDGDPVRLAFVGRLNDLEKNICLLPDMVSELKRQGVKAVCTVVGEGGDRRLLEDRIRRLGVEDAFVLTGAVPYADVPALLHQADFFLMPSRFEGCPHALMEAMATGCVPVVSRLRGTLDRIVSEGESGCLASVGDAREFAEAIARLSQDTDACRRMGRAARKAVMERFTTAHMAQAYAEMLHEVAEHPGQQPAPRPLDAFSPPASMAWTWRQWIPMPVKKMVRTLYGRLGRSI